MTIELTWDEYKYHQKTGWIHLKKEINEPGNTSVSTKRTKKIRHKNKQTD